MRRMGSCVCATSGIAAAPPSAAMKIAPLHSITSSARASKEDGMVEAERLRGLEVDRRARTLLALDREVGGVRRP